MSFFLALFARLGCAAGALGAVCWELCRTSGGSRRSVACNGTATERTKAKAAAKVKQVRDFMHNSPARLAKFQQYEGQNRAYGPCYLVLVHLTHRDPVNTTCAGPGPPKVQYLVNLVD